MGTFFQAWRRRQAEQQAAEWTQEQEEARHAVEELPDVLREQARRAVDREYQSGGDEDDHRRLVRIRGNGPDEAAHEDPEDE